MRSKTNDNRPPDLDRPATLAACEWRGCRVEAITKYPKDTPGEFRYLCRWHLWVSRAIIIMLMAGSFLIVIGFGLILLEYVISIGAAI